MLAEAAGRRRLPSRFPPRPPSRALPEGHADGTGSRATAGGARAELKRLRAETEKLKAEAAKLMAEGRRLDNNTTLDVYKLLLAVFAAVVAGTKAAESLGWL